MSLGLGKRYWVRVVYWFCGSLEECIAFMQDHKPRGDYEWFELRPEVDIPEYKCNTYQCSLVTKDDSKGVMKYGCD